MFRLKHAARFAICCSQRIYSYHLRVRTRRQSSCATVALLVPYDRHCENLIGPCQFRLMCCSDIDSMHKLTAPPSCIQQIFGPPPRATSWQRMSVTHRLLMRNACRDELDRTVKRCQDQNTSRKSFSCGLEGFVSRDQGKVLWLGMVITSLNLSDARSCAQDTNTKVNRWHGSRCECVEGSELCHSRIWCNGCALEAAEILNTSSQAQHT